MQVGPRKDTSKGKLIRDNFFFFASCVFLFPIMHMLTFKKCYF